MELDEGSTPLLEDGAEEVHGIIEGDMDRATQDRICNRLEAAGYSWEAEYTWGKLPHESYRCNYRAVRFIRVRSIMRMDADGLMGNQQPEGKEIDTIQRIAMDYHRNTVLSINAGILIV